MTSTAPSELVPARRRIVRWLPAVPLLIGVVAVAVMVARRESAVAPTRISSNAPAFGSLGSLVSASDVIVIGEVEMVRPGRAIAAPDDPGTTLLTELVELRVIEPLRGVPGATLIIEQVASLGDGTPVVLDGQAPSVRGERLLLFVAKGATDEFPYAAAVNGQSRYELASDDAIVGPEHLTPVDWSVPELRAVVAGCVAAGLCSA